MRIVVALLGIVAMTFLVNACIQTYRERTSETDAVKRKKLIPELWLQLTVAILVLTQFVCFYKPETLLVMAPFSMAACLIIIAISLNRYWPEPDPHRRARIGMHQAVIYMLVTFVALSTLVRL